jgi:hypothetical protein
MSGAARDNSAGLIIGEVLEAWHAPVDDQIPIE